MDSQRVLRPRPSRNVAPLPPNSRTRKRQRSSPASGPRGKRSRRTYNLDEGDDNSDNHENEDENSSGGRDGGDGGRRPGRRNQAQAHNIEDEEDDADADADNSDNGQEDEEDGGEGEDGEADDNDEDEGDEERSPDTFSSGKAKKGLRGVGIRSKNWTSLKNALVQGAKKLSGNLITVAADYTWNLGRRFNSTKRWIRSERPTVTFESLLERLPRAEDTTDDVWTQEKEDELQARFVNDPLREYITKRRPLHTHFWSLWRKTCQLRQVFPTDIIGPKQYLEYWIKVEVREGVFQPNPNWTRAFCEELDFLIVASPCHGDMGLLALFIRYSVACRINDKRQVPMDKERIRNPFFRDMERAIKSSKGSKSLQVIGKDVRQQWTDRNLSLPWEALVLEEIEKSLFVLESNHDADADADPDSDSGPDSDPDSDPEPIHRSQEFQPYPVSTDDLKTVRHAFEQVHDLGLPLFPDMEERFKVVSGSRLMKGSPENWTELTNLRVPLLLADMRIQEKRRLAEVSRSDSSDDSSARSRLSESAHGPINGVDSPGGVYDEDMAGVDEGISGGVSRGADNNDDDDHGYGGIGNGLGDDDDDFDDGLGGFGDDNGNVVVQPVQEPVQEQPEPLKVTRPRGPTTSRYFKWDQGADPLFDTNDDGNFEPMKWSNSSSDPYALVTPRYALSNSMQLSNVGNSLGDNAEFMGHEVMRVEAAL
ncbi:hypothetical protein K449DRAFT_399162 [Hypoxylon sp. EC38]|nr:hypothetical protein K449DRAFT_399162 [Hypoxylon sp. EC38]